jgi:hypothetical protein
MHDTRDGIFIDFNSVQKVKAEAPMYSTELGITTLNRLLHHLKAASSIPVTL